MKPAPAIAVLALALGAGALHAVDTPPAGLVGIRSFLPDKPVSRAGRPAPVTAILTNGAEAGAGVIARLIPPPGMRVRDAAAASALRIDGEGETNVTWILEADAATQGEVVLEVEDGGRTIARTRLAMRFEVPVEPRRPDYIPAPAPVATKILVGAHNCPLWEADNPTMWMNVLKHPERTPALGFYAQENPEVADWETKWAVEHGISFFIYCWYRDGQGGPVKMRYGSAIHDALFKSRFADRLKFTIMWENQARGHAGVADENDLMRNLLPFWMDTYFTNPGYLKVDNRPVLFVYRPEFLVDDLGGATNVARAFDRMRQACRDRGFDGLYILGEYRGLDPRHLKLMKSLGLDHTFAYCWPIGGSPAPEEAIRKQMEYLRATQALGILPQVATVSQAWSGWRDEGSIWKIPPDGFERLLREAKEFVGTLPPQDLGARMLLLDNWNEWGEGHYLAPYREYGFGYLDAVRAVFADAPAAHEDLLPEDIGRGPYDTAIRGHFEREAARALSLTRKAVRADAPPGLIGWWTFDEAQDDPVAADWSGHRLGGELVKATRAPGAEGSALVCDGGCVVVPAAPRLSAGPALTVECRVKTDTAAQGNTWMVNRVFGGGETSGYRLGVVNGHPCFQIPQTAWSHHLAASEPLATNRWVHLAGTFDGTTMRIYVDGVERGAMARPGRVAPNASHLVLGNFEVGHPAHFIGLLDDVRLYDRALSPAEIASHGACLPAASP